MRPLRWLERWVGRHVDAEPRSREELIGELADDLREMGFSAVAALAASEALVVGQEYGLRFDRVELDQDLLHWHGVYESGPAATPTIVKIPLEHVSEATQRGIGSLN